jgi:hypothetical protein
MWDTDAIYHKSNHNILFTTTAYTQVRVLKLLMNNR